MLGRHTGFVSPAVAHRPSDHENILIDFRLIGLMQDGSAPCVPTQASDILVSDVTRYPLCPAAVYIVTLRTRGAGVVFFLFFCSVPNYMVTCKFAARCQALIQHHTTQHVVLNPAILLR